MCIIVGVQLNQVFFGLLYLCSVSGPLPSEWSQNFGAVNDSLQMVCGGLSSRVIYIGLTVTVVTGKSVYGLLCHWQGIISGFQNFTPFNIQDP